MSDTIQKFCLAHEVKVIDEEERTIVGYVTTEAVDRSREVVVARGLKLANYRANPIVLKGHDKNVQVGRCRWIKEDHKGLVAKTQFADTDTGREEWNLYRSGFKKAFSIGFIPDRAKAGTPTAEEVKSRPHWRDVRCVYREAELYEYSTVLIPDNPEAVCLAYHAKSLDISPATALEMGIPETAPAAPSTKTYVFLSERTLRDSFNGLNFKKIAERANAEMGDAIKKAVADALHVAKGGV